MKNVTIENNTFAERVANLYIIHPRVQKIVETLDSIRRHNKFQGGGNSPRHRFVIGLSGVGKTQMLRRYAENNKGYIYKDQEETEYDIKPVLYVNLPDPFTIMEFYQSIVKSLGAPQLSGRPTIGEVKRQVFTLLEHQRVEMLILDEMDHILTTRFVTHTEAMSAIKHVANDAKVSVICAGTPKIENLRKIDSQHFRRYPPTKLERFKSCNEDFLELLTSVEMHLNTPDPIGLADMSSQLPVILHRVSYGLVGYLTPILQEAYSLLGVFDEGFKESSVADLKIKTVLQEAYQNIIGDVSEEEMRKMIGDDH